MSKRKGQKEAIARAYGDVNHKNSDGRTFTLSQEERHKHDRRLQRTLTRLKEADQ
jgi:hypothetical protein